LVQLQQSIKEIEATGSCLVAISFDSTEVLKRFAERRGITYPLLSDAGSKVIDAYDIRNKEASGRVEGIPYPGVFIVDQKGIIRAKLFHEGYQERHSGEDLIKALKEVR